MVPLGGLSGGWGSRLPERSASRGQVGRAGRARPRRSGRARPVKGSRRSTLRSIAASRFQVRSDSSTKFCSRPKSWCGVQSTCRNQRRMVAKSARSSDRSSGEWVCSGKRRVDQAGVPDGPGDLGQEQHRLAEDRRRPRGEQPTEFGQGQVAIEVVHHVVADDRVELGVGESGGPGVEGLDRGVDEGGPVGHAVELGPLGGHVQDAGRDVDADHLGALLREPHRSEPPPAPTSRTRRPASGPSRPTASVR